MRGVTARTVVPTLESLKQLLELPRDMYGRLWLALDLDNTLLRPRFQSVLASPWGLHYATQLLARDTCPFPATTKLEMQRRLIHFMGSVVAVEEDVVETLNQLYRLGCRIFGLTSRLSSACASTLDTLRSLHISFASLHPFPNVSGLHDPQTGAYFVDGIVFTNAHPKSRVLYTLLESFPSSWKDTMGLVPTRSVSPSLSIEKESVVSSTLYPTQTMTVTETKTASMANDSIHPSTTTLSTERSDTVKAVRRSLSFDSLLPSIRSRSREDDEKHMMLSEEEKGKQEPIAASLPLMDVSSDPSPPSTKEDEPVRRASAPSVMAMGTRELQPPPPPPESKMEQPREDQVSGGRVLAIVDDLEQNVLEMVQSEPLASFGFSAILGWKFSARSTNALVHIENTEMIRRCAYIQWCHFISHGTLLTDEEMRSFLMDQKAFQLFQRTWIGR